MRRAADALFLIPLIVIVVVPIVVVPIVLVPALWARPYPAQEAPTDEAAKVDAAITSAFPDRAGRLEVAVRSGRHDEGMLGASRQCRRRRSPTRLHSARKPASNILPTASSSATGRGARRSRNPATGCASPIIPPRAPNGGNCYACHQLTKAEVSYGTIGPEPSGLRQGPKIQRGRHQGGLREDLQCAGDLSLLEHAALRRQQGADHRPDQGPGRAGDEPGQPGEQIIRIGGNRCGKAAARSRHACRVGSHTGCFQRGPRQSGCDQSFRPQEGQRYRLSLPLRFRRSAALRADASEYPQPLLGLRIRLLASSSWSWSPMEQE